MLPNQETEFLIVLGTRPEAIKMAPLIMELRKRNPANVHVCATGQHAEMVDQALGIFGVAIDSNLHALKPGQSLSVLSAALLSGLDKKIEQMRPEWILVQGDTLTAAMAGLCGFFRRVKVGHIEAGLRRRLANNASSAPCLAGPEG
jgi:UDP-N-acetylglucosamine 2-epimerase (non-hydrolysing)